MPHPIADKSARVLIIDSRVDTRTMAREAVKALGFTNSMVVGTIAEAWELLRTEEMVPEWIISSMLVEGPQNTIQLLALFLQQTALHNCRLSLLIQDDETYVLPDAFALGLLSYHMKPFTLSSLKGEFEALVNSITNDSTGGCFTAYGFLRNYLTNIEKFDQLIKLEETMIKFFPAQGDFFLSLAEAQKLAGKIDDARKTISQAKYLGPRVGKGAKQLMDVMAAEGEANASAMDITFAQAFDIKMCVVIDPDDTATNLIKEALKAIGIEKIENFADGQTAWEWLEKNPAPQLIIHEWKVPKLSGPALVQRFRAKTGGAVPIVVVSSLVKGKDHALLREMGVSQVIEKPIYKDNFITTLMATLRQEKFPTSYKSLETKLNLALSQNKMSEARELKDRIFAASDTPAYARKVIEAQFAYYDGNLDLARTLAFETLKNVGDSLFIINLIGKIFLKMRAFPEAVKCFNKAQELSSNNLERICLLAEAQTEMGDFKNAHETIAGAKSVDQDNQIVKAAETKLAITEGDTGKAKNIMESMENLAEVVAYTNNRAVSLAKSGQLSESQELYAKALESLPDAETNLRAMVLYNLSLSHAKSNDLKKSEETLNKAMQFKDSAVFNKANSLKARVGKAIATGASLQLQSNTGGVDEEAIAKHEQDVINLVALDLKPGEACLHQVFVNPEQVEPRFATLLEKIPRFSRVVPEKKAS